LFGAHLAHADLTGAHLVGADLRWANLVEADLTKANLVEVQWSVPGTQWPEGMAELMLARSEEVKPGVWVVCGSEGPDRAPVPVG
jgi:hypothetical protein